MPKFKILIVDDEEGMREVCAATLRRLPDAQIVLEGESRRAAERLDEESPDLLITDICMPGLSGLDLLRLARQRDPNLAALILTAYPTVETAVECMKLGAADYLTKPLFPEELLATVQRLLAGKRLVEENSLLRRQVQRDFAFGEILGQSQCMQQVFETIQRAAETQFDVLIVGETGTGKELVARAIHQRSRRSGGPFVPVNCGAMPEHLMESELFGHERGAFSGAQTRSLGLMEFANEGTFFMDEITQMPLLLQGKLLRVLQERMIRRVGGKEEIPLDLRIVAASSHDPQDAVKKERFRLDLYHRINVVRVHLPPLRERREDIPLLAEHFLNRYTKEMERAPVQVTPEAMEVLTGYSWPGNVRELQNTLKRTLAMSPQPVISVESLPEEIVAPASLGASKKLSGFFGARESRLNAFEREYLRNLLAFCLGDVSAAAREAQLPRGTLYRLLKKYGLDSADFRGAEAPGA